MKKKPLLFALLALAIITSLTAGTLAVYTKSVSLAGDVQIKKFAFKAGGDSEETVVAVKLAPKESQTTTFTVTNSEDDKNPAEVDLNYTINVNIEDTAKKMIGLKAQLLDKDNKPLTDEGTNFTYTNGKLTGGTAVTDTYKVKLTWVDAGDTVNEAGQTQSDIGYDIQSFDSGLSITVVATQDT